MASRLHEQKRTPRTSHKKKPCRSRTYSRLKRACGSILEDPDLTKEKIKYVTAVQRPNRRTVRASRSRSKPATRTTWTRIVSCCSMRTTINQRAVPWAGKLTCTSAVITLPQLSAPTVESRNSNIVVGASGRGQYNTRQIAWRCSRARSFGESRFTGVSLLAPSSGRHLKVMGE